MTRDEWVFKFIDAVSRERAFDGSSKFVRTVALSRWVEHQADDAATDAKRWLVARATSEAAAPPADGQSPRGRRRTPGRG